MEASLSAVWRDYRNRRTTAVAALIAGLPMRWAGAGLDQVAGNTVPHTLLAAAWATACAAAVVWFLAFRCPFCNAHFHWTLWVGNPLARACLHCGFRKWKDPDAGRRLRPGDDAER